MTDSAIFRCSLCNKNYSRRDLRDRHRRRCTKTFGQERISKRKSCEFCAKKKLSCSLTRPSCTRCVQMGNACHYLNTAATHPTLEDTTSDHVPSMELPFEATSIGLTSTVSTASASDISAMLFLADGSNDAQDINGINWSPVLNDIDFTLDENEFFSQTVYSEPNSSFAHHALDHTLYYIEEGSPNGSHSKNVPSLLFPRDSHSSSAVNSHNNSSTRLYNRGSPMVNTFSNNTSIFGTSSVPNLSNTAPQNPTTLFNIVREYPKMMLQQTFWSPFIHHQLYRCSKNGMAEPLGILLACVSAYSGSVKSSFEFVDTMINSQRERLVREFTRYIDRPETCLAALHAVCVYQVLGIFGDPFIDRSGLDRDLEVLPEDGNNRQRYSEDPGKTVTATAELYGSFLLKMTRRLYKIHKKTLRVTLNEALAGEYQWSEWKFAESLRRNIFFVHMINILASKARKLHRDYSEPLNDDMVLHLPLPAPESMWRACSDVEWRSASSCTGNYVSSTPDLPLLNTTGSSTTLQGLLDLDSLGSLDVMSLQPLTRMILACHKMRLGFENSTHDE